MKKYILIIATLVLAITAGCKEEKKAPSMSDQMKTVMAAHDEVMPKLGKMGRLVGELNSKEDSTKIGMKYRQARIDLQDANKSMMDWMQSFKSRLTPLFGGAQTGKGA